MSISLPYVQCVNDSLFAYLKVPKSSILRGYLYNPQWKKARIIDIEKKTELNNEFVGDEKAIRLQNLPVTQAHNNASLGDILGDYIPLVPETGSCSPLPADVDNPPEEFTPGD